MSQRRTAALVLLLIAVGVRLTGEADAWEPSVRSDLAASLVVGAERSTRPDRPGGRSARSDRSS